MRARDGVVFRVLGPLSIAPGPVTSAKRRLLLATLLCHRNTRVSVDRLIEELWGAEPPASARTNLQGYVHYLRRLLGAELILHRHDGYQLVVEGAASDDQLFEEAAGRGGSALADGDAEAALGLFSDALAYWRGPDAYADVADTATIRTEADRLGERRQAVVEHRIDTLLRLGRPAEAAADARAVIARDPLRQRPWAQLMLALHHSGRTAEALETYGRARSVLIAEAGLEPGPELRDLQAAILGGDPVEVTGGDGRVPVPEELPPLDPAFTARVQELDQLSMWLRPAGGARVIAISGPGGIGKSALAVRAAYACSGDFPDGRLYLDLHGATPGAVPVPPDDAVIRLLRGLGVREREIPDDLGRSAALFRTMLAGRRALILLDNAAAADQVRPLLPGSASPAAVIITSRRPLAVLHARQLPLGTLSPAESLTVLSELAGAGRIGADAAAGAAIAAACGGLPLALRIAGARLVSRADWSLTDLRSRLADQHRRLDELQHDDLAVRSSCLVSVQSLPPEPARVFALLGLVEADVTVAMAAALSGLPAEDARAALDHLVDVQLVRAGGDGRCSVHDLVRLVAAEQAGQLLEPEDTAAALRRLLHHYLGTARRAARLVGAWPESRYTAGVAETASWPPAELDTPEAAAAWVRGESRGILAAARRGLGLDDGPALVAGLSVALAHPLGGAGRIRDSIELGRLVLDGADGRLAAVLAAQVRHDVNEGLGVLGDSEIVSERLRAWQAARELSDPEEEGRALLAVAGAMGRHGRAADAVDYARQAVDRLTATGDPDLPALAWSVLGGCLRLDRRFQEAEAALERALSLRPGRRVHAIALGRLAEVLRDAGRPQDALDLIEQAIVLFGADEQRSDEALAGWVAGDLLQRLGRPDDARARWSGSAEVLVGIGLLDRAEATELLRKPRPEMPRVLRQLRPREVGQ